MISAALCLPTPTPVARGGAGATQNDLSTQGSTILLSMAADSTPPEALAEIFRETKPWPWMHDLDLRDVTRRPGTSNA
jgi:hypothetical protein